MKAQVGAFTQEKALVARKAFSVIVKTVGSFAALVMNYCLPELSSIWWPPYQPLLHHTLRVLAGWGPPQLLSRVYYLSGAQVSLYRMFKCFFERLMFPLQSTSQSQHTRDHFHPEVELKFPRSHHSRVANAALVKLMQTNLLIFCQNIFHQFIIELFPFSLEMFDTREDVVRYPNAWLWLSHID